MRKLIVELSGRKKKRLDKISSPTEDSKIPPSRPKKESHDENESSRGFDRDMHSPSVSPEIEPKRYTSNQHPW